MQLSARDKVLTLFLPGLFVMLGYGVFFFGAKQHELNRALASLDDARAKAPAVQNQLLQAQAQRTKLVRDHQRAETERKQAQTAWDAAGGAIADTRRRNSRIERLNDILARRGLLLIEDSEAAGSQVKDFQIPASLEQLYKAASNAPPLPKPQLRKVRCIGRYLDFLAALEELSTTKLVAIPLGVSMKDAPLTTRLREWTLFVWI